METNENDKDASKNGFTITVVTDNTMTEVQEAQIREIVQECKQSIGRALET